MSKSIRLVFALVILTTILCNNSVCSQRGRFPVCGCRIHPNINSLQCKTKHNPKTIEEYYIIVECICKNPQKYLNEASKKMFRKMCSSNSQTPL